MTTVPPSTDPRTFDVAAPSPCSHEGLVLVPAMSAYECGNPYCRRLFEQPAPRRWCRSCREPVSAQDGELCWSCENDAENERDRERRAANAQRVLTVRCTKCGREPGERCHSANGVKQRDFHSARMTLSGVGRWL